MAKTAVLNKEDKTLIKVVDTAEEKKEFDGREDVVFMTSKNFEPTEQFQSWDEMTGKVKKAELAEGEAKPKAPVTELTGPYYIAKPLPNTAHDHPKWPIWEAIIANDGKTCEQAKAACPQENPKRKTSGVYTFASEMRYFVKTGYILLAEKPDGFDPAASLEAAAKAKAEAKEAEAKAKKEKREADKAERDAQKAREKAEKAEAKAKADADKAQAAQNEGQGAAAA